MAVTEIAIAGVAALIGLMAALVLVLTVSDRGTRRAADLRRARRLATADDEKHAGPPGYGRPPGYGPPPLWSESRRDPPPGTSS